MGHLQQVPVVAVARSVMIIVMALSFWMGSKSPHPGILQVQASAVVSSDKYSYLYNQESYAVTDYQATASHGDGEDEKPDFLYAPAAYGPRVVEFYSPWCPHCQHFKPKYMQFAQEIHNRTAGAVKVYAVSCMAHKQICQDWNIQGYPMVYAFAAGSKNITKDIKAHKLTPDYVLEALDIHLDDLAPNQQQAQNQELKPNEISQTEQQQAEEIFPPRSQVDIYNDAYLSFFFSLQDGIFMKDGPLSTSRQTVFQSWLLLLDRTLPPEWELRSLIRTLLDQFETAMQSQAALLTLASHYPPPSQTWSAACTKGNPSMPGYTCGLWQLFHIVSIGLVEYNVHVSSTTLSSSSSIIPTDEAADTLRDFIVTFFGCNECRTNFQISYDACAHSRCERLRPVATAPRTNNGNNNQVDVAVAMQQQQWKEFPLWLYETHNAVNVRLYKERTRRRMGGNVMDDSDNNNYKHAMLYRWPSRQDCPQCWKGSNSDDNGDQNFVPDAIYNHLQWVYWPERTAWSVEQQPQYSGWNGAPVDLSTAAAASRKAQTLLQLRNRLVDTNNSMRVRGSGNSNRKSSSLSFHPMDHVEQVVSTRELQLVPILGTLGSVLLLYLKKKLLFRR